MRAERPDERKAAIAGGAELGARPRPQRAHVDAVGVEQDLVAGQDVALRLRLAQRLTVDEQRLGVGLLDVQDAQHHGLDLVLDVVRLVDRQAAAGALGDELGEDQEQLEGLTEPTIRSSSAYLRLLKWKPPRLLGEQRDDLLDVGALGVVPEVDEDQRVRPDAGRCAARSPSRRSVA